MKAYIFRWDRGYSFEHYIFIESSYEKAYENLEKYVDSPDSFELEIKDSGLIYSNAY